MNLESSTPRTENDIKVFISARKPQIIDPPSGCSVLVGTKNQEIKFTVFGSPVPTVQWYQDNAEIFAGADFAMKKSNDLYFSLIIKLVFRNISTKNADLLKQVKLRELFLHKVGWHLDSLRVFCGLLS